MLAESDHQVSSQSTENQLQENDVQDIGSEPEEIGDQISPKTRKRLDKYKR